MGASQTKNKRQQVEIEIRPRTGSEFHPSGKQIYKSARKIKFQEKVRQILEEDDLDEYKEIQEIVKHRHELEMEHEDQQSVPQSNVDCLSLVEQSIPIIEASSSN